MFLNGFLNGELYFTMGKEGSIAVENFSDKLQRLRVGEIYVHKGGTIESENILSSLSIGRKWE